MQYSVCKGAKRADSDWMWFITNNDTHQSFCEIHTFTCKFSKIITSRSRAWFVINSSVIKYTNLNLMERHYDHTYANHGVKKMSHNLTPSSLNVAMNAHAWHTYMYCSWPLYSWYLGDILGHSLVGTGQLASWVVQGWKTDNLHSTSNTCAIRYLTTMEGVLCVTKFPMTTLSTPGHPPPPHGNTYIIPPFISSSKPPPPLFLLFALHGHGGVQRRVKGLNSPMRLHKHLSLRITNCYSWSRTASSIEKSWLLWR